MLLNQLHLQSTSVRSMITMSNCSNVTYFIIDVPSVLFKKERDNIISFLIQVIHAILITVNTSRTNAQTWGHLSSLIHHTIIAFIKVFHFSIRFNLIDVSLSFQFQSILSRLKPEIKKLPHKENIARIANAVQCHN